MKRLNVSLFCLSSLVSAVSADVLLTFQNGGNDTPSTDVTLSNLGGAVNAVATNTLPPSVNGSNNTFTESDASGSIVATFTAVDNSSSDFNPRTWTGGSTTDIQATTVGWGIIGDINGNIQGTEALLIEFDLSSTNLGDNKLVWTDADLEIDGNGEMVIWRKRANESTGQLVSAPSGGLSRSITIEDGDTFALIESRSTARFVSMTLDIVDDNPWNSSAVFKDTDGRLAYASDENGNRIMDFSHAGYMAGEQPIPNLPVVKTISPIVGDDTAHIQNAINEVAAMPLVNGQRGALLLNAGTYDVSGIVYINADGIVLRGVGQGSDDSSNTIILATGTDQKKELGTIMVKSDTNLSPVEGGTRQNITSDYIPAGSRTFEVEDGTGFNVGDYLVIEHLSNPDWLLTVNYGNILGDPVQWSDENSRQHMTFHGTVIAIDGNKIKLDTPIYHPLDRSNTQATVYRHSGVGIVEGCGVENLRVAVQNQGGTDEAHRWDCIHFDGARNSWAKDCTSIGFAESGFRFSDSARCTVIDCSAIEPVSNISGGRRYNFYMGEDTHDILVKRCYASYGRHDFVGNGAAATNGIVFTQSTSEFTYSSSENHLRWGSAFLWDNNQWNFPNATGSVLSLYNRGNSGTSHGWTGTNFVAWNNETWGQTVVCSEPPLGQNYAIGNNSNVTGQTGYPRGFFEAATDDMQYPSLYEAQLAERLTYGIGPDMPAKLRATHYENDASPFVVLEWTDIGLDETAYVVERSTNGGNSYTTIDTIAANSESYTDTTVAQNGTYTYRISATNAIGRSAYSNPVTVNLNSAETPAAIRYHFLESNTGLFECQFLWDKHNYSGKYFVDMGGQSSWMELDVDGGRGGPTTLLVRYAVSNSTPRPCNFLIDGSVVGQANFTSTGSWNNWAIEEVVLDLDPGMNKLRMQPSTSEGGPNVDRFDLRTKPAIYASGETDGQTAEMAFDSNTNTSWRHASPYGSWIEQSFPTPLGVATYGVTSSTGNSANDPATWQLLGSNDDGASWTVLDSRTLQVFSSRGQTLGYTVANGGNYTLYRLAISSVRDVNNADAVELAELSLIVGNLPPVTPDPAQFSVTPYAVSSTAISMTAVTGTSAAGRPIEYYFTETSGNAGGSDSGWISSPTYTDTGLSGGVTYSYTVTLRDFPDNEGSPSGAASATTLPPVQTVVWDPAPGSDGLWSTGSNWTGNSAPANLSQNLKVVFNVEGAQESVLNTNAVVAQLAMGDNGTENGNFLRLVAGANLTSGKALDGSLSWSAIAYNKPATMTVETGASFKAEQVLFIGRDGTGASLLDIQGGSVEALGAIRMGNVANTSSGSITIDQGGVLRANGIEFNNSNSIVDLIKGSLILDGDQLTAVANYITAGNLVTTNGSGTYEIDYDNRNAGKTTVSVLSTQTTVWNPGSGGTALWTENGNWTGGSAPIWASQYLKVVFNVDGAAEAILDSPASVKQLVVGDNSTVNGNFVRLVSGAHLRAGGDPDGSTEWTAIAYNRDATVTVEAGALFEVEDRLFLGFNGTCDGVLRIEGGQVNVASTVRFGHATDPSNGFIQVAYGGQLIAADFDFRGSASFVDVRQGSVLLVGDQLAAVNTAIGAGNIVGYGGTSSLNRDYDQTNPGYTTITAVTPSSGYERWTEDNGFIGAPEKDHDGDNRSNLYEYALNGDPDDSENNGTDPVVAEENGQMLLKHLIRVGDADLTYTVYGRSDLTSGTWLPVNYPVHETTSVNGDYNEVSLEVPTTEDSLFLKLDITKAD